MINRDPKNPIKHILIEDDVDEKKN